MYLRACPGSGWCKGSWCRQEEIEEKVEPGEYGVENYLCRVICLFIFTLSVVEDLRSTFGSAAQGECGVCRGESLCGIRWQLGKKQVGEESDR